MGRILNLAEFRGRRPAGKQAPHAAEKTPESGVYFCNRCASEEFRLSPLGKVTCSRCGALMRNICVTNRPLSGQRRPPTLKK
jgi:hypothetical protein